MQLQLDGLNHGAPSAQLDRILHPMTKNRCSIQYISSLLLFFPPPFELDRSISLSKVGWLAGREHISKRSIHIGYMLGKFEFLLHQKKKKSDGILLSVGIWKEA